MADFVAQRLVKLVEIPRRRPARSSGPLALLGLFASMAACGSPTLAPTGDDGSTSDDDGSTTGEPAPVCGNGIVEDGEECDDGNQDPGDGCRTTCLLEDPPAVGLFAGAVCTCVIFPAGNVRCWGGYSIYEKGDPDYGVAGRSCGAAYLHDFEVTPAELGDLPVEGVFESISISRFYSPHMTLLDEKGFVYVAAGPLAKIGMGLDPKLVAPEIALYGPAILGGPAFQVADGYNHACAVMEGGNLLCWGDNQYGQLGYGHTMQFGYDGYTPTPEEQGFVPIDGPVAQVAAYRWRTCARLVDGRVRCWGYAHPELGPSTNQPSGVLGLGPAFTGDALGDDEPITSVPAIDLPLPAVDISMTAYAVIALLEDGSVYVWGHSDGIALGVPGYTSIGANETPAQAGPVDLGGAAIAISGPCALIEGGDVRCWGSQWLYPNPDKLDVVGDDESPASVPPIDLGGPAVKIVNGTNHACAMLEDGSLRCWGLNEWGQLGYGHTETIGDDETPAQAGPVPYQ